MPYNKEELFNLPVQEKLELVEALWESIDEELLGKEMTRQGFEEEIDKRIAKIEKNPDTLVPWEEVLNQMRD
ncbi:MAG: addiction module protein [Bacteroidota bacterium]|nr:addiction module protein [Bacteroidota bacterium]